MGHARTSTLLLCLSFTAPIFANTLTYQAPATDAENKMILRRSGETFVLTDAKGAVLRSASLASTTGVIIRGADGATNDTLKIDLTGGTIDLRDGIQYDGGIGGYDVLDIAGPGGNAAYRPARKFGDGQFVVDGLTIRFTNLEPTTVSGMASFTFVTPGSDDVITIDSPAAGQNRISGTSGGVPFEALTFFNITNVTIDMATNDGATPGDSFTIDLSGLVATGLQNFTVVGGAGNDAFVLQNASYALPAGGAFTIDGGAGADTLTTNADIGYTITDTTITSSAGGTLTIGNLEFINLIGGASNNTFVVNTSSLVVAMNGGAGTDTVDYSGQASAIGVNLGLTMGLSGTMDALQETPPVNSTATGTVAISNYDISTHTFDIAVTVSGITPAQVNGMHIHAPGPPGVAAPIIVDLTAGPFVPAGSGFTVNRTGVSLPALNEAAFLGGVSYLNVHTIAFPNGEIRGQLVETNNVAVASGADSHGDILTSFENAIGGAGNDSIVGSTSANNLQGNGGNDIIVGGPGADTINGGANDDILVWSNGDGSDVMDGGTGNDTVLINGSTAAGDQFLLTPNGSRLSFQRTNLGVFTLDIGTVETLTANGEAGDDTLTVNDLTGVADLTTINLNGFDGLDTFNVTPNTNQTINVHGGLPNPPGTGDTLNVNLTGTSNPSLTVASNSFGLQGSYTFGNRMPVNFQFIETLNPTDLTVTKSGPAVIASGSNITYTVTVSNAGTNDAVTATLSDTLPAGTTFVSNMQTTGPTFGCTNPAVGSGGTINCTAATFAAGASATFTIVLHVNAGGGTITNTATIGASTSDTNTLNNTSSSTATVTATSDVSVTKTGPANVATGGTITYTIVVTNNGPNDAQTVTLTDVLPANTTFQSESQTAGPAFTCMNPAVGTMGTVTCSIATLVAAASATFTITVNVNGSVAAGSTISNTATVSSTTTDPAPGNNSSTAMTPVVAAPAAVATLDPRVLVLLAVALAMIATFALKSN